MPKPKPIVAIQMDPFEAINPKSDSTLLLGLEAQKRGYQLFCYTPDTLSFENGAVTARGNKVTFYDHTQCYFESTESSVLNLREAKVVLLRQDPPFNMAYITTTHVLESLAPDVFVTNNPAAVRNNPEKWFVNAFPEFLPPTLISRDIEAIIDFRTRHKEVVIKPLYGFGGNAVFHLREDDSNFNSLLEWMSNLSREPFIIQEFIPAVRKGDKRIIFVDGRVGGAMLRTPASGEIRSNLRAGGSAHKTELTAREQQMCAAIGPELKKRGIIFAGVDVIGDYLTEINITSPTGLRSMNALYNLSLQTDIWDAIEANIS